MAKNKQPLRNKIIGGAINILTSLEKGLVKFQDMAGIATTPKIANTQPGYSSRQTAYPVPLLPTTNGQPQGQEFPISPKRFSRTGTKSFAGFIMEDYLALMQGRNAIEKFDEMYRSDSQVYAAVRRGNKKLKNCDTYFEPVDANDPEETKIAEALDYNFFSGNCMKKIWRDYMNELLTFRRYGISVFEPTFDAIKHPEFGVLWIIKDLGWISPKTIWQMFVANDYVWSFRQISTGDDYSYVDIPGEGLLCFTYDGEGNNLWGLSPLRPMYASYLFKDIARQVNAMGMENNARGAWIAETPEDKIGSKAAVARADSLNNFTQGTIPWIENIKGWLLTFCKIDYQADAVLNSMNQFNADISKCVQAEHQELGLNDVGAKAMNQSKEASEDESLMDDIKYICEKFAPLIKWFVVKNFGERAKYPQMKFNGLESKPTYEHAQSIALLTDKGYMSPTNEVQRSWVLDTYGIPGGDDIEEGERGKNKPGDGDTRKNQDPNEIAQEDKEHGELIRQIIADAKQGKEKPVENYAAQIAAAHKMTEGLKKFGGPGSGRHPEDGGHDKQSAREKVKNYYEKIKNYINDKYQQTKDLILPSLEKSVNAIISGDYDLSGFTISDEVNDQIVREFARSVAGMTHGTRFSENIIKYFTEHIYFSEFTPRRTLTNYETKINFAEIKNTFDGFDEKYGDLMARSFKDFIIPKYKKALKSALDSANTQSAKHSAINHVELGSKTKFISLVKDFMAGAVIEGRKQALSEIKNKYKQFAEKKILKVSELSSGVYGWVKGHAENAVNAQYATITKIMTQEAQNGLDNNLTDEQTVFNAGESGQEYIDKTRNTGEQIIPVQSVNEGRFSLFQEYKDQIQGFQYSAILDESTCDYCAALDGATFQIDDPDSISDTPPIHPQCRCILVPILLDEETPEWDGLPEAITEYVSDPENDISLEDIQKLKKLSEVK